MADHNPTNIIPCGPYAYPRVYQSEVEVRLGRRLFTELERIDQTYETTNWDHLSGAEQSLDMLAIGETIRNEATAVLRILSDDGKIDRGTKVRE